jgi:hypothetical protein
MPSWSHERRDSTEYRWILSAPADTADMSSALHAASIAWERANDRKSMIGIRGEDNTVVVSFTVPRPPRPTRGHPIDVLDDIEETDD